MGSGGNFVGSGKSHQFDLTTICRGVGPEPNDDVDVYVRLHAKRACRSGWTGGCISDKREHSDQTLRLRVTFDRQRGFTTLWHRPSEIVGGLQMSAQPDGSCTASFSLHLRPVSAAAISTHGTRPFQAVSTTEHCTDTTSTWRFGTSLGAVGDELFNSVPIGTTLPATPFRGCAIAGYPQAEPNCLKGDQAYARGHSNLSPNTISFGDGRVFKPVLENLLGPDRYDPGIHHFSETTTGGSPVRFNVVSARPPSAGDTVHKVGRTTGWTSGQIPESSSDPTCPGNAWGIQDNRIPEPAVSLHAYRYYECLVWVTQASRGGDSGSPVFVREKNANDVILVGVLVGVDALSADKTLFVPIERIYAESLIQGYDWLPEEIRPIPKLSVSGNDEKLQLDDNGAFVVARFGKKDFSSNLYPYHYKAVLFRSGNPVRDASNNIVAREVSGVAPVARFDISSIPLSQRSGEFTVKVRLCPQEDSDPATPVILTHCSDYGSDGDTSLKLPPPPQGVAVVSAGTDSVRLNWTKVSNTIGYEIEYREVSPSTSAWVDRKGSVKSPPAAITGLTCGIKYEFRVRAYGDGSATHDSVWGFWSQPASGQTAACPRTRRSAQADEQGHLVLSWPAASDADHYALEIPAIGYMATVDGGATEKPVPWSSLYGLRGQQTAKVWSCDASGLCSFYMDVSFLPPAPAPKELAAAQSGAGKVDLRWEAVEGADGYRVEVRADSADAWSVAVHDSVSTAVTIAVDAATECREFRVRAHGDGTAYVADWGPPSAPATVGCNSPPEFTSSGYSFQVGEDAATSTAVGIVSAVDPDGDAVSYSIIGGNEDGRFAIGGTSGEIIVAGALDYETASSFTLTVEARDGNGGADTVEVEILVAEVAETPAATTLSVIPAPQSLSATSTPASATLTWNAPDDPSITGYRILRRTQSEDGFHRVADVVSSVTTFSDSTNMEPNIRYEYKVRAIRGSDMGRGERVTATT